MTLFRLREGDGQSRAITPLHLTDPLEDRDDDLLPALPRATQTRLIAEIEDSGHVRFATAADGRLGPVSRMSSGRFENFDSALDAFMDGASKPAGRIASVAVAADGITPDGSIAANGWQVRKASLGARFSGAPVRIYDRLEAIALATPHMGEIGGEEMRAGDAPEDAPKLVLEVGSQLRGALAVSDGAGWHTVPTSPGAMAFSAACAEESRLIDLFSSVGDFLAGDGLARLHRRMGGGAQTAEQVFQVARHNRPAASAVVIYGRYLGRLAGDLVLATGAFGGVWLTGLTSADTGAFRQSFLAGFDARGGSMDMTGVPVRRITVRHPALVGLAAADIL